MNRIICIAALLVGAMTVLSCSEGGRKSSSEPATSTPTTSENVEQVLIQMERDWNDAWLRKDPNPVERILADDFTLLNQDGASETKTEMIAELKSDPPFASMVLDPMKVRVFGDTAVVTGGYIETEQGEDRGDHYVWTTVFVKRNERWQAVASQEHRLIAKPQR
jgi:uncharacterized protein (TIGR02246 family)